MIDTDELQRWLHETADAEGAAVMRVPEEPDGAPFAFSVGVWRNFRLPEAVVVGLPHDVAVPVLHTYVAHARQGRQLVPGRLYDKFLQDCPITCEIVSKSHYLEFFGSAFLMYPDGDFPALQLLMPTMEGAWPWQPGAPEGFAQWQPVLTDTHTPESWIPGRTGP